MDVLIKNMEMPKETQCCYTIFPNGKVIVHWDGIVFGETKAIELPPHGDLIDKASALSLLRYYCDMREYKKDIRCEDCENRNACVVRPIMDEVNKLDTVLEAST